MATLTQMHSRVVRLTGASTYTQTNFLEDINTVKDKFWSKYVTIFDDDKHYQEWTIDWWTIALQSEYSLKEVATDAEWVKILKSIAVNYNWETYTNTWLLKYITATEVNRDTLPYEWNYYLENQSVDNPIYFLADNSVFIAPVPLTATAWSDRLKVTWIRNIQDYLISDTDLIIPSDFHWILELWVIPFVLQTKRVDNWEVQKAQNDYIIAETDALNTLWNMKEWPIFMSYPDASINEDILVLNARK